MVQETKIGRTIGLIGKQWKLARNQEFSADSNSILTSTRTLSSLTVSELIGHLRTHRVWSHMINNVLSIQFQCTFILDFTV